MTGRRPYFTGDSLQQLLDPRGKDPAPDNDSSAPARATRGVRALAAVFTALVGLYHAEHCLAEVITGSTGDGVISLAWEYDLEQATGQVTIENLALPLGDPYEQLYLAGLIPEGASHVQFDQGTVSIDPCGALSAAPPPGPYVFANLPPAAQTTITFETCTPTTLGGPPRSDPACGPTTAPLEYGTGFVVSSVGCFVVPHGQLNGFVTVAPIPICEAGDYDGDGDIDLEDFARFQSDYTGPSQP